MAVSVRPARPDDPAGELLYEAARAYYDAFTGDPGRARALLRAIYPLEGHPASFGVSLVAELDDEVVGVLAAFGAEDAQPYARRFASLALRRLPPASWPAMMRHLRAAALVSPTAPAGSWYVDSLAVDLRRRRRGIAAALLDAAEHSAAAAGRRTVALDTGIENRSARALYEARGFHLRAESPAPDRRTARALGGAGFVSYVKEV